MAGLGRHSAGVWGSGKDTGMVSRRVRAMRGQPEHSKWEEVRMERGEGSRDKSHASPYCGKVVLGMSSIL